MFNLVSLPWLGVFKYLNQCHCFGWEYLNVYFSVTDLALGIQIRNDEMTGHDRQTDGHSLL